MHFSLRMREGLEEGKHTVGLHFRGFLSFWISGVKDTIE